MKKLVFSLLTVAMISLFSGEPASPLKSFPAVYTKKFTHNRNGWISSSYWVAKMELNPEGFLKIIPSHFKDRKFGRVCTSFGSRNSLTGSIFDYSALVKGNGKMRLGISVFGLKSQKKNELRQEWGPWIELTDTWKDVNFKFDFSKRAPNKIFLNMETDGELCVKSAEVKPLRDPSLKITSPAEYIAVRGKDMLPGITFQISKPFAEAFIFAADSQSAPVDPVPVKADAQGRIVTPEKKGPSAYIRLAAGGNCAAVEIESLTPDQYDVFNDRAKKIKTDNPMNILVIGDSLLDKNFRLNLGNGSIMQTAFWLNLHNPGKFDIRNAAVRGDDIGRVWNRICFELKKRKNAEVFQSVYNGIFQYPANLIYIQLGHNDTKSPSIWNYSKPVISPEKQKQLYRQVLAEIRKVWPKSRIVLGSSTTGNYVRTKQISEYFAKKFPKKRYDLFCIPEFMEHFNAVLQEIAPEFNAEWYDIYTPLKAMAQEERAKLFDVNDGVHLSPAGQRYFTMQYLNMIGNMAEGKKP